jgi:ankyrin repeat protein
VKVQGLARFVVFGAAVAVVTACSSTSSTPRADSSSATTQSPTPTASEETRHVSQTDLDQRLIDAAWQNDVPRARRLIEQGADVNHQDETQQSAYLIAASEGYVQLLDLALAHGAQVNDKDSFDGTALIRAAERGHADVVGRLVRAGIDLDHVNNLGWTALHEAVVLGEGNESYVDTVRVLVAAGVDVGIPAVRDGLTARQHAEQMGQTVVAATLARAEETRKVDLIAAATTGDADDAAMALRQGMGLEVRDEHRRTPLLLASTYDRVDVARLLVALGADPDALDDRHDTPWLVTGVTGSVAMLEALLPAEPDLTIRNRYGGVSVIPASERGHVDYVRRVVKTGIDVDHVNDLGWTALLEAVILGDGGPPYHQIVRILLDAGADPAIADADGVTALQHAIDQGQTEVVRILRERA